MLPGDRNSGGGPCIACRMAIRCALSGDICKIVGLGKAWRLAVRRLRQVVCTGFKTADCGFCVCCF